jgi:acetyl esterase/lipase
MIQLSVVLSIIGLFFSAWIIIPAPIFLLLPLSVGVPELSSWLKVLNFVAVILNWSLLKVGFWARLGLISSLIALGLSHLPLWHVPFVAKVSEAVMSRELGQDYLDRIPASVRSQFRSSWLSQFDVFRGISIPEVRQNLDVEFARPDGVPLKMNVYRPMQPGKNPAIVMIYGGAWRSGQPSSNQQFSKYMAAQGYTVLAIDYRHAPQYKFPAQLDDVKTALKFIQQHADDYDVNLDRIALMGRSAGAHLAMLAAFGPEVLPIRAVVDYYGPVDLIEGYNNPPVPDPINSRDVLRSFLGGTPQELPDLYCKASPYYQVRASLPPTLLIYGERDYIVQSKFGRELHEKLKAANNTSVFIEIPWSDHAFDEVFNGIGNQLALYYTERFLASRLH